MRASKDRRPVRSLLLLSALAVSAAVCGIAGGALAQATKSSSASPVRIGAQLSPSAAGIAPSVSSPCSGPSTTCSTAGITTPCKITGAGSYKLTANVSQSSKTLDGIEIAADHVTLNLNGYRVIGPVNAGGSTSTCVGINACPSSTCHNDITVMNGTVTAFGGSGVQVGGSGNGVADLVHHVRSISNGEGSSGGAGFSLGDSSIASNDISYCNGWEDITCSGTGSGDGLDCGANCVVINNAVGSNASDGIVTGNYGNIENNAVGNHLVGIAPGTDSGYGKNVVYTDSVADFGGAGTALCGNIATGTVYSSLNCQ